MINHEHVLNIEGLDEQCVGLVNCLNDIDGVETIESCCGHLKYPYRMWFRCNNFSALARIGRAVERNYSDGKWVIEVTVGDVKPLYGFCLRSVEAFKTYDDMQQSLDGLIDNIKYWQRSQFDEYFS